MLYGGSMAMEKAAVELGDDNLGWMKFPVADNGKGTLNTVCGGCDLFLVSAETKHAKLKTVPVGLLSLKSSMETEWPVLIAGLALSCVPVVIVYLLFQKQLIRDMTSGGVKG